MDEFFVARGCQMGRILSIVSERSHHISKTSHLLPDRLGENLSSFC